MVEIKEQEKTYRLTDGIDIFDTKQMSEEEFMKDIGHGVVGGGAKTWKEEFRDRFKNANTEDEIIALDNDAQDFQKNSNLEEIEGEWGDFKVYLNRKKEEMAIKQFKHEELNDLLKRMKSVKSESDLVSIAEDARKLAESKMNDKDFMSEFEEFVNLYDSSIEKILQKISRK